MDMNIEDLIVKNDVNTAIAKLTARFGQRLPSQMRRIHEALLETCTDQEIRSFLLIGMLAKDSPIPRDWLKHIANRPREACCQLGAKEDVAVNPLTKTQALDPQLLGERIWQWSYRWLPDNDKHALSAMLCIAPALRHAEYYDQLRATGLARWVDGACTTLTCSPELFASLAMTNIAAESYQDIQLPWPAFCVKIPDGALIPNGAECKHIRFAYLRRAVFYADREPNRQFDEYTQDLDDAAVLSVENIKYELLLAGRWGSGALERCLFAVHKDDDDDQMTTQEVRALRAAARVVVGLLYTMQYTNNFKETKTRAYTNRRQARERGGPPEHRNIQFGAPITVDVRGALSDYIRFGSGKHAPPSVQSLVRGHYKRQPIGPGQSGRKVIWIEPYWRGPEDAPILSRPHVVGPDR
jgi:hypothetical protein